MSDEIVLIDSTGNSGDVPVPEKTVVDDRETQFKNILKDTGIKNNINNIYETFFSGDIEDGERLVRVLKKFNVRPDKIDGVYSVWFGGRFPDEDGIDIYGKSAVRKEPVENEVDADKIIKDINVQDMIAQKNRLNMLQAKKLELEMKKQIKELDDSSDTDKKEISERLEPVMIMNEETGELEVATDKNGVPITKRIIEPINTSSGSSSNITELIMLQKLMSSDKGSNNNNGLAELRIQNLEGEITRLKERHDTEIDRYRDRISDKEKEISQLREEKEKELSRIREEKDKEILKIKEDYEKEIKNIRERHEDKIEYLEQRHADAIKANDDRWQAREDRLLDKLEKVEKDAADQINGLQYRHQEDINRLHADYKEQIKHFAERADDNLDTVKTVYTQEMHHKDEMDAINKEYELHKREMEKKLETLKNMSDSDRQTARIIEAVSGGAEKIFEVFGKPYAANMQAQAIASQQLLAEQAMLQKQRKIDEMRSQGYSEDDINEVVKHFQPVMQPVLQPQVMETNHDEAYEQILTEENTEVAQPVNKVPQEHREQPGKMIIAER